jgi:hypothetical protein
MTQSDAPPLSPTPRAPAPPASPAGGQDRFLLAIVVGTLLLVAVGVVVVFTFGRSRPVQPVDPNSPAGVVHGYVEAVRAGDADRARTYLTRQAQVDFDSRLRTSPIRPSPNDRIRIVVETVSVTDTTAEVKVTISHFYAGRDPFSSNTSHRDLITRLIREDGAWKLSVPPWAYELI